MSKIDEMVQQLCPDGVEYKRFDEACALKARIGWQRLTKSEQMKNGEYLLITGTDFSANHRINYETCVYVSKERYDQDSNIQLRNGDVLITKDGTLGKVAIVENLPMPATLNGGVFVVRDKSGALDNKFIAHYLLSSFFKTAVNSRKTGSTISHLTQSLFSTLLIPIPPLGIQREIVRVLDSFAELEAELEARKAQYAHYRDELLSRESLEALAGGEISKAELGDLMTVQRGASPRPIKQYVTNEPDGIPWIKIGDVAPGAKYISQTEERITEAGANKSRYLEPGSFVLSNSMSFGRPYILQLGGCIHDGWISITNYEEHFSPDFLYHLLNSHPVQKYWDEKASSGAVRNLNSDIARGTPLLVPPLSVQQQVVDILDRFDALTTSLTDGLPAEIKARRQQYEYYRDKLLGFPRKEP